jgi:hypothetical protein
VEENARREIGKLRNKKRQTMKIVFVVKTRKKETE